MLHQRKGSVRSIDIANELDFSKPSVSVAMKNLRLNGYIEMDSNGEIRLLEPGLEIAQRVLEKHTLITKFLLALGVSPEVAAEDACRMEHVISNESFEAIRRHAEKHI
jgi:Mn-dependent DtxR family transcriptional regulator